MLQSSKRKRGDSIPGTPHSEASEVPALSDVEDRLEELEEEEDGEDLFDESMMGDYRVIPELDQYEEKDLDNQDYESLTFEQRARAEAIMQRRDAALARRNQRLPSALHAGKKSQCGRGNVKKGKGEILVPLPLLPLPLFFKC